MTREEKQSLVRIYCSNAKCSECVLNGEKWTNRAGINGRCLSISFATDEELDTALSLINQTGSSTENGGGNMEKSTVTIDLDRYVELIRKETIFDELMKDKGVNMYLYVKEDLTEDMNNGK